MEERMGEGFTMGQPYGGGSDLGLTQFDECQVSACLRRCDARGNNQDTKAASEQRGHTTRMAWQCTWGEHMGQKEQRRTVEWDVWGLGDTSVWGAACGWCRVSRALFGIQFGVVYTPFLCVRVLRYVVILLTAT